MHTKLFVAVTIFSRAWMILRTRYENLFAMNFSFFPWNADFHFCWTLLIQNMCELPMNVPLNEWPCYSICVLFFLKFLNVVEVKVIEPTCGVYSLYRASVDQG